ncbi:hypothetical protein ACSVDE_02400 [Pseudalkalibacillus sp. Hm43]|uniref:hypothetical protein n=1 Tax=Pseudalkalibacillus sp. Hm43 TaxID=3450742 RepID=UPI003F441203
MKRCSIKSFTSVSCPIPLPSKESPECTQRRNEIDTVPFTTPSFGQIFFINQLFIFMDAKTACQNIDNEFSLINEQDLNDPNIIVTLKQMFTVNNTLCSIVTWALINGQPKLVQIFGENCVCVNGCLILCEDVDYEVLKTPSLNCPAFVLCIRPPA